MRIALELLGLVPGRIGGMETYARHLVRGLAAADTGHEFRLIVGSEARGLVATTGRVSETVVDDRAPALLKRLRVGRSLWQWALAGGELRAWKYDVLHCTLNLPRPAWGAPRMVLTLPDLNFEEFPELWGWRRARVLSAHTRCGVHRARAILTLSEYAKRCIVNRYNVPPHRIRVTYCGVDRDRFRPAEAGVTPPPGTPDRYLYCPANTWPHKNHPRLIEALALLRDRGIRIPLLLSGAEKHGHAALADAITRHRLADQVTWLGYVSAADLVRYYQHATAVVFPTLHEGFGLPVLEAMACGCPVACSATTATGEIAGDGAVTFDPTSVEAIADAVGRVVQDAGYRELLAGAGFTRAASFTWERMADQTLEAYRAVRPENDR
jgi:glycosyltransferase involved in cell wall biosynthesis